MDDILLEPLKAYKEVYEKKFDENTDEYFKQLVKNSGMDVAENRDTVKKYEHECSALKDIKSKLSGFEALRGFLIFVAIAGIIMIAIGIYLLVADAHGVAGAVLLPVGVACAVVSISLCATVLKNKIKALKEERDKKDIIAEELKNRAWGQMAPLNALFESGATKYLIEKTVPRIDLDDNFNMRRYDYLSGKYGFGENAYENRSTIAILTGEILGNPFVVDREIVQSVGSATYEGSIVIHWTTTYSDSEGHTHTQHHTQTLTATVTKPKPIYSKQTRLIYGNESAPDLVFSRKPTHAEKMSEKELESAVKAGMKKIRKKQEKQMQDGGATFTEMGNEEFDALFGALDRNNEVQFRLLFTPLAQKNMLELMKDGHGYGDDFYFKKRGCLNFISSEHSAQWDLDTDCERFRSYDIDLAYTEFKTFNRKYFKSLYFDLAPLLAIPLYQQHKPREYIYMDTYPRNYTSYEAEYAVNKMGTRFFEPALSRTQSILKTSFIKKDGASDEVQVTAHAFRTEERVDYVSVLGGDGYTHSVPVHWLEYIPISQTSTVKLKQLSMSDTQFAGKLADTNFSSAIGKHGSVRSFSHGILCCLVGDGDLSFDTDINNVLQ